jgi:hypothetical protein
MAITRLHRRRKKNKLILDKKLKFLKYITSKPVIKKVDIDKIKKSFKATTKQP